MSHAYNYAADILLGEITIEEVPEARQRSVQFMLDRLGPIGPTDTPRAVVVGLMRKIEKVRKS